MITALPGRRHLHRTAAAAVTAAAALVAAGAGFANGASASTPGSFTISSVTPGDGQLTIDWTIPSEPGQTVHAYHISLLDQSNGGTLVSDDYDVDPTVSPTQIVTGLFNGDPYQVSIEADFADNGGSVEAANNGAITATPDGPVAPPPGAVPNAPTNVMASPEEAGATVDWNTASNGYSTWVNYTISWIDATDPGGSGSESAFVHTEARAGWIVETPLTVGDSYTFFVTATNSVGTGPASAASASIVPYTLPESPTGVRVTARDRAADVSWKAPASTGFNTITDYVIAYQDKSDLSGHGDGSLKTSATATHAVVPGLRNGSFYTFTVQVEVAGVYFAKVYDYQDYIQSIETSAPSAPTLVAAVPGSPSRVSATTTTTATGPNAATVAWAAPASDGGAAISGYRVVQLDRTTHTARTTGFGPAARSAVMTGLIGGHQYSFTVLAANSTGLSTPSAASAPVTILTPLTLVSSTFPTAVTVGLKSARAAFTLHLNRPAAVTVSLLHGTKLIATTRIPAAGPTVTGAVPIHPRGTGALGGDTWVIREATTGRVLAHHTVSVKQASSLHLTVTRTGKTDTLTGLATYASLDRHRVLPWAGRTVLVQRHTAHGWRTIRTVHTNRTGHLTLELTAPAHTRYRLIDTGTPTTAGTTSPAVTR